MRSKFFILFFFALSFAYGQENYRASNFSLAIKGTSNLHDWQSTANEVRASGSVTIVAGVLKSIQVLSV
ncbi:MAG: hypothetical protein Q7T20_11825, partial [Saprospiraceae bacterium]|nr:hypothetical protein [Saprospiraceae bacterium]